MRSNASRYLLVFLATSLVVALSLPLSLAATTTADEIVGLWKTEPTDQGFARVRMAVDEDDKYYGEIVALSQPLFPASEGPELEGKPKTDRNNPDPKRGDDPVIGLRLAWGFTYDGDGVWSGGRIYDPENGKTYKCKITLNDDGTLAVRGFIGFALLGRTTVWTPIEE